MGDAAFRLIILDILFTLPSDQIQLNLVDKDNLHNADAVVGGCYLRVYVGVTVPGYGRQCRAQAVEVYVRRVFSAVQLASGGAVPRTDEGRRPVGQAAHPAWSPRRHGRTYHAPVDLPGSSQYRRNVDKPATRSLAA